MTYKLLTPLQIPEVQDNTPPSSGNVKLGIVDKKLTLYFSDTTVKQLDANLVESVAGRTGDIVLDKTDVGLSNVDNKSSATILSELTSTNVTSALGFTPYASTNPNNYITSSSSISGNAATATKLATARTINGVSFNGTADINIATKLVITSRANAQVNISIANALLPVINRTGSIINVSVS